jgi:adenylate kinase
MRVLLIGPPGSGKGTQAGRIADHFDLTRIATGDALREHVARDTPLGRQARDYMQRGDLVPDQLVIAMVKERVLNALDSGGYVLDGYPRTLGQAEAAYRWAQARGVPFDCAVFFETDTGELLRRLADRATLEGRSDDSESTIRHRLEVFETSTRPLVDYYASRGILVRIDAVGPVDAVTERVLGALHTRRAEVIAAAAADQ